MRQAPLPKHPKRPAAPPARSRRALPAPATQVERFKPAHARSPAKRSSAPAHWTPEQKRRALALLREYESGPKPGSAVRALDRLDKAYEHNPVARNPIVGRKGLLGGVEDLVKTADPIALGQTLAANRHPIRAWQKNQAASKLAAAKLKRGEISQSEAIKESGVSYGIMAGGPAGGFRGEAGHEPFKPPSTRAEAEARLAKIDQAQAKVEARFQGKHKGIDPAEQLRRNRSNGLIDLHEKTGKSKPGTARALRAGRQPVLSDQFSNRAFDEFVAKHHDHPVVKAYTKRAAEGERLRALLNTTHMPGEESVDVFAKPAKAARKKPAKVEPQPAVIDQVSAKRVGLPEDVRHGVNLLNEEKRWTHAVKTPGSRVKFRPNADQPHGNASEAVVVQGAKDPVNGLGRDRMVLLEYPFEGLQAAQRWHHALDLSPAEEAPALRPPSKPEPASPRTPVAASGNGKPPPIEPPRITTGRGKPSPDQPPIRDFPRDPNAPPPAEVVGKSLGAMRLRNREVAGLRKAERSARMARGEAAHKAAGGGIEGHRAFLHEQRGEMPDLPFDRLSDASKEDVDQLFRIVDDHDGLKRWEKVAAQKAIGRLVAEGRRPRPHEVRHLNTVFGPQFTENLVHTTLAQRAVGVIGIPRSLMASFDVSAPLRQNLMGLAIEPRIGLRNLRSMYRSVMPTKGGEAHYAGELDKIHAHPDYELAVDSGLSLTELAGKPGAREEAFPSQYAEQLNVPVGGGHSVGPGHIVRASGRAYTGYLDNVRFQMFSKYVDVLRKKGIDPESYPELHGVSKVVRGGREYPNTYSEGIAKLVNSATGRGHIKNVESWGPFMNVMFFSPRLMYSRLNFLDPSWYFRLDPFSRRQALKGVARLSTTAAGTFALSAYLGAQIGTDPRSANFAKIRLGNTRVDILGGFQQYIRLMAQLYTGEIVSSTTGQTMQLGHSFGQQNRLSILSRFAQGKLSPPASLVTDFFRGTTFADQPFTWKNAMVSRITPLVAQDALDLYHETGSAPLTALGYAVSAHGVGMQTYGPRDVAKQEAEKSDKAAKEQNVHIQHLVQKGVLPKRYVKELRHSLDLYNEREALNAQIEHAVPDDHPHTREVRKTLGLIALLEHGKVLSPARADHFRKLLHSKAPHATATQLSDARDSLWQHTAGKPITWYHKKTGYSD